MGLLLLAVVSRAADAPLAALAPVLMPHAAVTVAAATAAIRILIFMNPPASSLKDAFSGCLVYCHGHAERGRFRNPVV
jgi:hypothetical protein